MAPIYHQASDLDQRRYVLLSADFLWLNFLYWNAHPIAVLTAEDVHLAISHGVDGILVSNHGARQLDGAPATLEALPECVAAAAGRIPIHIDGGFRRGSDIFKALALGASCCWIGRPVIWGLSYDGQAGVELALSILHEEFMKCMQLMGCRTVKDIRRSHLAVLDSRGFLEVLKDL